MEKIKFSNSRNKMLSGAYYPVKSDSGIIISHGFTSNKDRERFVALSEALGKAGFAVLRFDFSGCGESDPDFITVKGEVDDLESAIRWMKRKGHSKIGLVGESLGGLISLKAYTKDLSAMVLWAPVTEKKESPLEMKTISQIESVFEDKGKFVVQKKDGREFRIKKGYFKEREAVNQKELLSRVKCPVLIIHGDQDQMVPLEASEKAVQLLPVGSKLEILKGAGHKFNEHSTAAITLSVNWLKNHF